MQEIPGHPMYSIDRNGAVYSKYVNRIIKSTYCNGDVGYYKVGMVLSSNPKRYKYMYIHQLVLLTFVGPCPVGMQCAHLDGDPSNNKLSNLKYVTAKENTQHQIGHGRRYTSFVRKVSNTILNRIRDEYTKGDTTYLELASKYKVSERTIIRLLVGK